MRSFAEILEAIGHPPPAWHADAACREHPELNWVPVVAVTGLDQQLNVCASCLVRTECLTAALDGNETGVWGGMSERARRTLRRDAA